MEAESTAKIPRADIERYHAAAVELADAARRIVAPAVEGGFEVETKPDASLVTDIDHAVERRLRELIGRWFPDHGVIGEEYPRHTPRARSSGSWIRSTGPRSSSMASRRSGPCSPSTIERCR